MPPITADGERGTGRVRIRARILTESKKLLRITEIPFGVTTEILIDTIVSAAEKGKIKIARIEDNTAQHVDILVHLPAGVDPEQTKKALFAFSACEVSVSPNACVIVEDKPRFMRISDILRYNTDATKETLRQEQEIRLQELNAAWHQASLEKIFIENRIYLTIEDCETWEEVLETIDRELQPFARKLRSPHYQGRPDPADGNQNQAYFQIRRLQGRSAHSAVGGGHRPDAEKPQPAHQIHHPLV